MRGLKSLLAVSLAAAGLTLPAAASAADPRLLRDIATTPDSSASSLPAGFAELDGVAYFAADDGVHGIELWRSDGSAAGTQMVADIAPGAEDGRPVELTVHEGTLYFSARTSMFNPELWRSDGTEAGTEMVEVAGGGGEINPSGGSWPVQITPVGSHVYFQAETSAHGKELWRAGPAGAQLVADVLPGVAGSNPFYLTALGSRIYFAAEGATGGRELWRSDGLPGGTVEMVVDIAAGDGSSLPSQLVAFGGQLIFNADDGVHGDELWRSDGVPGGTTELIDDLMVNGSGSAGGSIARELTPFGSHLYFIARSVEDGVELWRTSGAKGSVELVTEILPDGNGSNPDELTLAGERLYFSADSGPSGSDRELWVTGGEPGAEQLVADIVPGVGSSSPVGMATLDGRVYFGAEGPDGQAFWRTGASGGVERLGAVVPVIVDGEQSHPEIAAVAGSVFFAGDDGQSGIEPWIFTPEPAVDPEVPVGPGAGPVATAADDPLRLRLWGAKRQVLRGARATLSANAQCSAACSLRVGGTVTVRDRRAGGKVVARVALPKLTVKLAAATKRKLTLRLSRAATKRLRGALAATGRRATAALVANARADAGPARSRLSVTLTAP